MLQYGGARCKLLIIGNDSKESSPLEATINRQLDWLRRCAQFGFPDDMANRMQQKSSAVAVETKIAIQESVKILPAPQGARAVAASPASSEVNCDAPVKEKTKLPPVACTEK